MRASTLSRLDLLEQNHGPQGQDVHVIVLRGPGRTAVLPDRFVCSDGRDNRASDAEPATPDAALITGLEVRSMDEADYLSKCLTISGAEVEKWLS